MMRAGLTVINVGPQISIQDAGRPGLMRYGVPASGPMDRFAFAIANLALGNLPDAPAIEVSLGGLTLHCTEGPLTFCVAGGDFQVLIDDARIGAWVSATLQIGQTLTLRPGRWGNWCYLAFMGDLVHHPWLGSASTHGPTGLGAGHLVKGGRLHIETTCRSKKLGAIPCPVSARPRQKIRVVLGPQERFFSSEAIATFLTEPFVLTDAYDRMGVRLSGRALPPNAPLDMPSEAILRGSIQVAGDGVATVLLADHQTTGGYPKIATILSDDLDNFVQLRSRSRVAFEAISATAAISAARTRNAGRSLYLAQFKRELEI
jgi:biotin-dependent carboxylase-like uncharacterized protein